MALVVFVDTLGISQIGMFSYRPCLIAAQPDTCDVSQRCGRKDKFSRSRIGRAGEFSAGNDLLDAEFDLALEGD